MSDNTRRILAEEGFLYHMDDYSRDEPFWDVVERAASGDRALRAGHQRHEDVGRTVLHACPMARYAVDTFERLYAEGADRPRMMSLGLHLRVIGRPGGSGRSTRFLEHVRSRSAVWVATRRDIAEHFASRVDPPAS